MTVNTLSPAGVPAAAGAGRSGLARVGIGAALAALGYAVLLAVFSPEGFPTAETTGLAFPFLSDQPVGEDGYYLLLAAWNLAAGQGLTGNFGEPITGIQPLVTLVYAGLAWVIQAFGGDKFDLARAVILAGAVNLVVFAGLVARLTVDLLDETADRALAATVAFTLAATSFYLFRTFTYGLETGLYLALIAAAVWLGLRVHRAGRAGPAASAALGLVIGLGGLARIDFGLVVAVAYLVLLATRRVGFASAVITGVVALAVVAPWFLWVKAVSGSFMPSSGPAQASLVDLGSAFGRARTMGIAVAQNLTPWSFGATGAAAIAAAFAAAVALWLVAGRPKPARWIAAPGAGVHLGAWTLAFAVLPVVYWAFFWAAHFYPRYTAPLAIPAIVAIGLIAARTPAGRRVPFAAGLLAVLVVANGIFAWRTHHAGRVGDGHAVTAGYVATKLPREARVGAFQSGVTGFYSENVINLDGKVNVEALEAMRTKTVEAYLDRARIDYVVDWEGVVLGLTGEAVPSGRWVRCPEPVGNSLTVCFMRKR